MIKVHKDNKQEIFINHRNILSMNNGGTGADIKMLGGTAFSVVETPEEVLKLIDTQIMHEMGIGVAE